MNYGYAPVDDQEKRLELSIADEPNRYFIQLYHHVVSAVDLKGLDILEIGSGRGGGACYMKRYLRPKRLIGVDYSKRAVEFCNESYTVDGLSFETGDAESLPFDDESFDVVVNIESSHCYGSIDAFLAQVRRVLRLDGYFLYADHRGRDEIGALREKLSRSGMTILKETDITRNVVEALNLDSERKLVLIRRSVPKIVSESFEDFAGIKGTRTYEGFRSEWIAYMSFMLQKD